MKIFTAQGNWNFSGHFNSENCYIYLLSYNFEMLVSIEFFIRHFLLHSMLLSINYHIIFHIKTRFFNSLNIHINKNVTSCNICE